MAVRLSDPTRFKRPCPRSPLARRASSSALALVALVVVVVAIAVTAPILIAPRVGAQELESPAEASQAAAASGDLERPDGERSAGGVLATVLSCFHRARLEASTLLELGAFLASEELPEEVRTHNALRDLAAPLVQACLDRDDFETGERIFRHAVALAQEKKERGEWNGLFYTSWTFPSSMLRMIAHDSPGGGLERIAFHQFVARRDGGATVKPSHSTPRFGDRLLDAFESAGGSARPAEALDSLAGQLHELCREAYPELLGIYFMELLRQLPPAVLREAIAWADGRALEPDLDWAPLAREFAMAGRLILIKTIIPARQGLWGEVPDPASCQAHYLAVLRNRDLPHSVRITIARNLCDADPRDLLEPELVLACAEALAAGLAVDSPASVWACFHIAHRFNRLADLPEWEPVARRLHAAWVHANRSNDADRRTEAGFWPETAPALEMLRLSARLRDPEALPGFLADGYVKDRIKNNAVALFLLVENGHHNEAAALLPGGMDWMDISDDYPPKGRVEVRYSGRIHRQLPAFLAKVEDPALRYLAELLIVGAPDLPPAEAEAEAGYLPRGQRLREAALRFAEVDFEGSPDGAHLRTRVFEQIAAYDGPAREIRAEWERSYSPEAALTVCSFRSAKNAEHAAPPFATFAAMRLRDGDLSGVSDMLEAVRRGRGSVSVRRTALEHFSLRFIRAYPHHWPSASPEELALWLEAFELLLGQPGDEFVKHRHLPRLAATHLAATLLAEADADGPAWLESLDPKRAALVSAAVREHSQDFLDGLQAALKYRVSHPVDRASPERRARATLLAFSNPGIQEAFGKMNPTLFARLQAVGHLDPEQLLGGAGQLLVGAHPRGGWAAAELARLAAEAGDFETALRWSQRSLADCGDPAQAPERYARLVAAKAGVLVEAGRPAEALELLDALAQQIDPARLSPGASALVETSRRRAEP